MSSDERNLAASVKQRLLNLAISGKEDFNRMQVRYGTERLLYRLSVSPHAETFLLKGAMLFVLWEHSLHRPTRDIDLLFLRPHEPTELEAIFREVANLEVAPDGLQFDINSIHADEIREDNTYGGIRIKLHAYLGTARIPLQIDVGLGDAVHPEPQWSLFTTLLDFPAPRIRAYPIYTVIAEKFQAMVELGQRNSRMKDYFDVFYLQRRFDFGGSDLQAAITATFKRRRTAIPAAIPTGLSEVFWASTQKQTQWSAFLRKNQLSFEFSLKETCASIAEFVMPAAQSQSLTMDWIAGEGWQAAES